MAAKKIVFPGNTSFLDLSLIDYIMIGVLLGLLILAFYYIFSTHQTVKKVENFANYNNGGIVKQHFIFLSMSACGFCKKFDDTFTAVKNDMEWQKKNGLSIKFDKFDIADSKSEQYRELGACDGFPCYMLLDATTNNVIMKGSGYRSVDDFKNWLLSAGGR